MDNDLMARRLRPPSQPAPANGQPTQPPSPWDVPLAPDGEFAATDGQLPQQDPPFAPPDGAWGPDPQARADVPWDRPDPEPWPPAEQDTVDQQTWSALGAAPAAHLPDWPAADSLGTDDAPPWDKPAANEADQAHDPYDSMAPVVSDVTQAPAAAWSSWNGNGFNATPGAPEPMTVVAHNEGPPDPPQATGPNPLPDWPAEDDLTVVPPTNRGPVMPEDSWPVAPPVASDVAPEATVEAAPEPAPEPPVAEMAPPAPEPVAPTQEPEPIAPAPEPQTATPPPAAAVTAIVMPAGANPQNMVLRIEVAIVDESRRANPADAAKRVSPDSDVRRPEYEPRHQGSRAPMPEPEYIWDAPPVPPPQSQPRRARQPAPTNPPPPVPARSVSPPPSAWQPAAPVPPEPMTMDWDLPSVGGSQPMPDPTAPWATPTPTQPPVQPPTPAPAPTWALTQPAQSFELPAPQYPPTYAPQSYQPAPPQEYLPAPPQTAWPPAQPAWPPAQPQGHDPLAGLPAAPYTTQAPYSPSAPPVQAVQSAPAAGSRARIGQASANQADLWFLANQPAATVVEEAAEAEPDARSSSILTSGLTIGFALLVIVLVLVFIQLMTSLLR